MPFVVVPLRGAAAVGAGLRLTRLGLESNALGAARTRDDKNRLLFSTKGDAGRFDGLAGSFLLSSESAVSSPSDSTSLLLAVISDHRSCIHAFVR